MLFRIDATSPVPLGEQIAANVRGALAEGSVLSGERLPAARQLAESLNVNVHTVLRGYQRLREEGLIELRRGRGAVVTGGTDPAARARLAERVQEVIDEARRLGLSDDDLIALVQAGQTAHG